MLPIICDRPYTGRSDIMEESIIIMTILGAMVIWGPGFVQVCLRKSRCHRFKYILNVVS
jgi:hypothetical protein